MLAFFFLPALYVGAVVWHDAMANNIRRFVDRYNFVRLKHAAFGKMLWQSRSHRFDDCCWFHTSAKRSACHDSMAGLQSPLL